MKKQAVWLLIGLVGVGIGWNSARAAETPRWLSIENTLGIGYDDNLSYTGTNKVDRMRLTDRLSLSADRPTENGFVGLRYQLSYTQYDSDDALRDETFWAHQIDADLTHTFSPKLTLGVRETFLFTERPEIENPDGTIRREDSTYYYNTLNLNASSIVTPRWRTEASGRWQTLRYSEVDDLAQREDYDKWTLGLSLLNQIGTDARLGVEGRYSMIDYTDANERALRTITFENAEQAANTVPDRGWDLYSVGLTLNDIVNPSLLASLRAGWEFREYEAAHIDNDDGPYVDASLTYLLSPDTRITASGSYSLYQSGLLTYAGQTRTAGSLSIAHDLTSRLTGTLLTSYILSEYEGDTAVSLIAGEPVSDAEETAISVAAQLAYRIGQRNWLQAGYTWSDFDSDLPRRADYDRNTVDISWRVRL
ncbi:MAG: outer membrane beta-barrel protein [Kiritimatiellae bacterium]|nr:outer membrane beta-barrel protein [Kiritimatiellia bacterium]